MNQESSPETILQFLVVGLRRAYFSDIWSMQNGVTRYVSPGPASLVMNHLYAVRVANPSNEHLVQIME